MKGLERILRIKVGDSELELGGRYLEEMRDSNDVLEDPAGLKERMDEDGYLLVRGLQEVENITTARRRMLEVVEKAGILHPAHPMMDGVIAPEKEIGGNIPGMVELATSLGMGPSITGVAKSSEIMGFFEQFLGGPVRTLDYKWLRYVGPGMNTGIHYDIVYMSEGTENLFTVWCPFGDVPLELGGLILCAGSHKWEPVKETYGEMDVYRDNVEGTLSEDPIELVEKFGGQWKTTSYFAGDIVIFTMYTAHGSSMNQTNRVRVSMDSRYQLASDPIDERWMANSPFDEHGFLTEKKGTLPMKEARKKWGI